MTASQQIRELTGTAIHDAICYSGYRQGQNPRTGDYPSFEQIHEDLGILRNHWTCLRLYDCSRHAELTLEVVRTRFPDMRVLLGVDLAAEVNNPDCPWGTPVSAEQLLANRRRNEEQTRRAVALSLEYGEFLIGVSGGNEATVDWTDGLVPVERVAGYLKILKEGQPRPVTLCENNVPWHEKIADLVPLLDFISVHSYPAWENIPVEEAMAVTEKDYLEIAALYPGTPVIITEAGWTTISNGRGILPDRANTTNQATYCSALADWSRSQGVPVFMFEGFDEPWKGSDDVNEPEKHWGFFYEDRSPKPVMAHFA